MSTRTREAAGDYYAALGVAPGATTIEIRRAYRELARQLHPDVNKRSDAARFAAVTAAYDTLSDPARRRAYDQSRGASPTSAGAAVWGGAGVPEAARRQPHASTAPVVEPSLRGPDVRQTVHLSLREAAFGANKTITVPRRESCGACHGTGAAPGRTVRQCPRCHGTGRGYQTGEECERCHGNGGIPAAPCTTCSGLGRLPESPQFPLRFPPAVENGEELRIRNEGDAGPQGGPRGDLRLHIAVDKDPVLSRRGAEVYADLTVTSEQAAHGATVEVPTLRAPRRLTLPKNVQDGTTLTMRGQGLRLKGRWRRGDQHVSVRIQDGSAR